MLRTGPSTMLRTGPSTMLRTGFATKQSLTLVGHATAMSKIATVACGALAMTEPWPEMTGER